MTTSRSLDNPRLNFLRALAAAGVAVSLAACGGGSTTEEIPAEIMDGDPPAGDMGDDMDDGMGDDMDDGMGDGMGDDMDDGMGADDMGADDMMRSMEDAEKWKEAIDEYKVSTTIPSGTLPSGTTLNAEYENGQADIVLSNADGISIDSAMAKAPTEGMIAERFTIEENESRGVIITSRGGTPNIRRSYDKYFFTTYDPVTLGNNAVIANPIDGVTGVTVDDASLAVLGNISFTANTSVLRKSYFTDLPTGLAAGGEANVTFLGVDGELSCASACAQQPTNDPTTFTFSTNAVFTPKPDQGEDLSDLIVNIPDSNSNYFNFGYWLTTTGSGDSLKHEIEPYATVMGYGNATAAVGTLAGSATYSGGAAGVYVLSKGDIAAPGLYNGEFIAEVDLKADFNTTPTDNSSNWKITGNVSNFESVTNDSDNDTLDKWTLSLSADLGARTPATALVTTPALTLNESETDGGGDRKGEWSAYFYGEADSTTAAANYPEVIVGDFDGHFTDGSVVGVFGAKRD